MKMRPIIIMAVILIISILGISVGQAAPDKLGGGMHVVQWGENLASIAARYGTTVQALAQANGITDQNYIYIGQQLVIPSMNNIEGWPPANSQTPFANSTGGAHIVKYGDTLTSIAMRYGATVDQLLQANGLTSSIIYIGQQLAVPGSAGMNSMDGFNMGPGPVQAGPGPVSMYSVKAGDTLSSISFRFGTSVNDIMQVNNLYSTMILPGQQLAIPGGMAIGFEQPAGTYYTIQHGDTLAGIALRYGTTLQSILQANNLSQSQFIFPGQELVVPGMMMSNPMPQQAMGPGMMPQMPQMSMMPNSMGNSAMPMSPLPGSSSMAAPIVPQQTSPVMPSQSMPPGQQLAPPMVPPNVTGGFPISPVMPKAPPGVVFDNEPFLTPDQTGAPDLTMIWQGRIVSQNQPEDWKYPAVLRVNVGGAKGMQVSVSKKGSNSWSTTGFTGTKPEYGDGAVEFAPLNPGKHVVSLDGQGKGASMTVDIRPNSLTYVEFVRVRADTGPVS